MCLILVHKVKAIYGSLNTGVGIGEGGGGHRGQGPLNFCHRGLNFCHRGQAPS